MITVRFFAQYRDVLGVDTLSVDAAYATVGELRQSLQAKGNMWQQMLGEKQCVMALNQTLVNEQAPLKAGDEVAFFPPVTGG